MRIAATGLATGLGVSLVTFVVAEPYAFLDWQRFTSNVVEQSEMVRRIRDYVFTLQYVDTPAYWYQVQQLATWGLGWPLGIVAWGGLLYAALRGMRLDAGLAYIAAGWGLPIAILLYSSSLAAIVLAAIVAFAAPAGDAAPPVAAVADGCTAALLGGPISADHRGVRGQVPAIHDPCRAVPGAIRLRDVPGAVGPADPAPSPRSGRCWHWGSPPSSARPRSTG